jgi:hypothetical protein
MRPVTINMIEAYTRPAECIEAAYSIFRTLSVDVVEWYENRDDQTCRWQK